MAKQEINNDKGTVRLEKTSLPNHISNLSYCNQLEALNLSICNENAYKLSMRSNSRFPMHALLVASKCLTLVLGNKAFREFQVITKQHITFETVLIDIHVRNSTNRYRP